MTSINNYNIFSNLKNPYLIAEIGGNHEGNFETAKAMTQLAIEAAPNCIKFQLYSGSKLVNGKLSPNRNKHFEKFELTKTQHLELVSMCANANIDYCASIWDLEKYEWIDKHIKFYKIGSGDLTCYALLKIMALSGKPIILSTGLSTIKEVRESLNYIRSINSIYNSPNTVCLMQCTSMYPIPDSEANLNTLISYQKEKNVLIGYSDHTIGSKGLETACAMGAQILEFHFTDSRINKNFRDHKVSLTKSEVIQLKTNIKKITELKGSGIKRPTKSEIESNHVKTFRRAIYFNKNVIKGTIITDDLLVFLRPETGLSAKYAYKIVGKKITRDVDALEPITFKDFE